jgi:hypothetical protein
MLTNYQIENLAKKMNMPLERVCFKNELAEEKLKYNIGYILNSQDDVDEDTGKENDGAHWCALYVQKTADGKINPFYFDSFGIPPSEDVKKYLKPHYVPYSTKDIQSILADFCGFACLAFLYFVSTSHLRSGHLYKDCETFLDLFDDLNTSHDFKKNEWILSQFFQAKDPLMRKEIDVFCDAKTEQDPNIISTPVECKYC